MEALLSTTLDKLEAAFKALARASTQIRDNSDTLFENPMRALRLAEKMRMMHAEMAKVLAETKAVAKETRDREPDVIDYPDSAER
jgi:hypothetical protein